MIKTMSKVGNSRSVIFDAAFMESAHLQAGDELNTALAARFKLC